MTLLGKLFRPWDQASEDQVISCEDTRKKKSAFCIDVAKDNGICRNNTGKSCGTSNSSKHKKLSGDMEKVHRAPHTNGQIRQNLYLKRKVKRETSSSNGSEDTTSEQSRLSIQDMCSTLPTCCEPASPADFDLYCNGNAFLYPNSNTLNELARLSRHELTAMGLLPPEPASSLKVRRQRPKRFQCPHCQVAFSNNGQLRGHIRIHTGERPFVCEEEGCGKSFTRNEELTRHRRIHSGLRPFPCSYCGKKFGRKDHLKKHTRTHQRGVYNPRSAFVIGYGNPFQPFHQNLLSSTPFATPSDLISLQSQYSAFSQQTQPLSTTTTTSSAAASASASSNPLPVQTTTNSTNYAYPHHNPFLYHNTMNLL